MPKGALVQFNPPMFVAPTMTYFSTAIASTGWYNITDTQASGASSSVNVGKGSVYIRNAGVGGGAPDAEGEIMEIQYTAEGEM
jgi:hypothetical protein